MVNSKKNSKNSSKKCSKGQILREGYTTKTKKKVPPSCITAQSATGKKSSLEVKKYLEKKEKMHKAAMKRFSKEVPQKCPPGQILREGFKKESYKSHSKKGKVINVTGSWTKPECIPSVTGKSSKGPKLITIIEKDVLGKYGYSNVKTLSKGERYTALRNALKVIKPLSVYRRIIALSTLNKNKDSELYEILKSDANWIKTQDIYIKDRSSSKNLSKKTYKNPSKINSKKPSKNPSKKTSKK
jgi:hypothetical protein